MMRLYRLLLVTLALALGLTQAQAQSPATPAANAPSEYRLGAGDAVRVLPSGKTSSVTRIVTMGGDLAEAVAGQRIDAQSVSGLVPVQELCQLRRRLSETAGRDGYGTWAKWFLGDTGTRTLLPSKSTSQ